MREIPKWFQRFVRRLLPIQKSSGHGAVQVGKVDGQVTTVNLTQHIYAPVHRPVAVPAPAAVTAGHKDVLNLMRHLPNRIAVLDFMEREFGTRMVIELNTLQVKRLRRYVEVVLTKGGQQ